MSSFRKNKIRKEVAGFYDKTAGEFSRTRNNWWSELDFIHKYIAPKGKLLDFGCGNGRLLEMIKSYDLRLDYTGVDLSEQMIGIAKNRYPEGNFLVLSKENELPFNEEEFQTVVSIAVFHHFTPSMAKGALQEMNRVLKPGGRVIATSWYLWDNSKLRYLLRSFWRNILAFRNLKAGEIPFSYSSEKGRQTYWRFCYWWSKEELEKSFKKQEFKIIESGFTLDKKGFKRNIYVIAEKRFGQEAEGV
ncbi:MAG: class I SAM-dependent methyltransferase [Patescibacteria group bacterium]